MKVQIFSKQFFMPLSNLYGSQDGAKCPLNFQLFACTSHTRFGKPLASFNVISNRAFILDASLSWLAFFPKKMVAMSHRESGKAAQRCRAIYYFHFVKVL